MPEEDLRALAAFLLSLDFTKGVKPVSVPTANVLPGMNTGKNVKKN